MPQSHNQLAHKCHMKGLFYLVNQRLCFYHLLVHATPKSPLEHVFCTCSHNALDPGAQPNSTLLNPRVRIKHKLPPDHNKAQHLRTRPKLPARKTPPLSLKTLFHELPRTYARTYTSKRLTSCPTS